MHAPLYWRVKKCRGLIKAAWLCICRDKGKRFLNDVYRKSIARCIADVSDECSYRVTCWLFVATSLSWVDHLARLFPGGVDVCLPPTVVWRRKSSCSPWGQSRINPLEVFLNDMRYINPRFTYLLTYLPAWAVPYFRLKQLSWKIAVLTFFCFPIFRTVHICSRWKVCYS